MIKIKSLDIFYYKRKERPEASGWGIVLLGHVSAWWPISDRAARSIRRRLVANQVLGQALHMQEQSFVWFTYLSVQALHMQKAPLARLWRNAEIDRFSRAWLIWCKRA